MIFFNNLGLITLIFAVYEKKSKLREDVLQFLNFVSTDPSFQVLLVYNGELTNLNDLPSSIKFISNPTQGYDLNCYLRGFLECKQEGVSRLIFLNNSIEITDPLVFIKTLKKISGLLDNSTFVSFSLSEEIRPHFQSFLFGINLIDDTNSQVLLKQICLANDRPFSRYEVIQEFELKTFEFVVDYLKWTYSVLFIPSFFMRLKAYVNFLLHFGFFDNIRAVFYPNELNFSIFLKKDIHSKFGFKKIKSSSILNKWNEN